MASSLLFMAITIFAFRGFFLGFVGVIGKVLGLILGYVIALSYRGKLAAWVGTNTTLDLPALVIEVGCGAALFFTTLFGVGFIVSMSAGLLKKIIPPLEPVLENDSTAGRVTGAITNGSLGAAIVLLGIWGYGLMGKGKVEPEQLQHVADTFGNLLAGTIKEGSQMSLPDIDFSKATQVLSSSTPTSEPTYKSSQGSAVIVSESQPDKIFSIETTREEIIAAAEPEQRDKLLQLLGDGKIQELLKNPQIQQIALQQLKNNPEQLSQLGSQTNLDPEQLQELLKKLQLQEK